jgi:magnesium-transporting ATPase (P-type)
MQSVYLYIQYNNYLFWDHVVLIVWICVFVIVRYVGGSEEKIRELFKDAEREQAEVISKRHDSITITITAITTVTHTQFTNTSTHNFIEHVKRPPIALLSVRLTLSVCVCLTPSICVSLSVYTCVSLSLSLCLSVCLYISVSLDGRWFPAARDHLRRDWRHLQVTRIHTRQHRYVYLYMIDHHRIDRPPDICPPIWPT